MIYLAQQLTEPALWQKNISTISVTFRNMVTLERQHLIKLLKGEQCICKLLSSKEDIVIFVNTKK